MTKPTVESVWDYPRPPRVEESDDVGDVVNDRDVTLDSVVLADDVVLRDCDGLAELDRLRL